jgi:signal transduction histidine kinase
MNTPERRARLSWASVGLLAVLCGVLAFLQNNWIHEISRAEKERLQNQLQTELSHLSREFNNEISSACSDLLPSTSQVQELGREKAYSVRYSQWKESHDRVFSRIALVVPQDDSPEFFNLVLFNLDLGTAQFSRADWPANWSSMRNQLMGRLTGGGFDPGAAEHSTLIDLPRFDSSGFGPFRFGPPRPGPPAIGPSPPDRREFDRPRRSGAENGSGPGPRRPGERDWLIVELNLDYVRGTMLPELLHRHLGGGGKLDYQALVVDSADSSHVIFEATPGTSSRTIGTPDASVSLFSVNRAAISFRERQPGRSRRPPPTDPGPGRWRLLVRHQAGSLEAVVARARWHNLAISAGILLLILATGSALVRLSRRVHQLAELQMNFVAGVSHELRTPLTVIRTAAFNLRGKLANKPDQVERYGKLIQDESEKLAGLVDQVLRFSSARAGRVIQEREPVDVETLIDEGLQSSHAARSGLIVEKHVEPGLPMILADEMAMKHALQNLLDNAVKYGIEGSNWIGVFASSVVDRNGPAVEVRVADRGPGIPLDEQDHIFDPFFRGSRAVQDQVHGTGLGLNLVKKIVEAHGGTIRVKSEQMKGTEFVMRIPAAPAELRDEFAHSIG